MNGFFKGFMTNETGGADKPVVKEPPEGWRPAESTPPLSEDNEFNRKPEEMTGEPADAAEEDDYSNPAEAQTESIESSEDEGAASPPYTGEGTITVRVFLARRAIPLENVKIIITSDEGAPVSVNEILYTDRNGLTEEIALPAPDSDLSRQSDNTIQPYAVYYITPELDGYYINDTPIRAVVFDNIGSIQNIAMIPAQEQGV